jgi:hypothetical protein
MNTELEAYLGQAAGLPGYWRPCHPRACPAREARVPLIRCTCHLKIEYHEGR